jgi:hypothetical protein
MSVVADSPIPLYVGIPLAMLCVGACIFMIVFVIVLFRETK